MAAMKKSLLSHSKLQLQRERLAIRPSWSFLPSAATSATGQSQNTNDKFFTGLDRKVYPQYRPHIHIKTAPLRVWLS